ncbi:uncharacterized protein LOC144903865 [Branchiostoma floridae x Branchiostoma belcheri]
MSAGEGGSQAKGGSFVTDWKNEKEVEAYLGNLETEFGFQCYHEKLHDGCHRLANFYEQIRKDYTAAAKVLKSNCENNQFAESCFKLGTYHLVGRGQVEKSPQEAFRLFNKSCDMKFSSGCHNMGLMYQSGMAVEKKDFPKAAEFYKQGCALNNPDSCFRLGTLYLQGVDGIDRDFGKALEYSLKSCEMGHMLGCANVGHMYHTGDAGEKNPELAEKYKKRAKDMQTEIKKIKKQLKFGE